MSALRVTEEQQHDLAAVIGERAFFAVVIGQRELACVIGAGDVDTVERLRALLLATEGERRGKDGEESKQQFPHDVQSQPATHQAAYLSTRSAAKMAAR
jgi:hypothetical protein